MVWETWVQSQVERLPKTLKMVLDTSWLNTQEYKVCMKGKVDQSRERSSALNTPRCRNYWKGVLLVTLDYGRQLYLHQKGCPQQQMHLSIYLSIYLSQIIQFWMLSLPSYEDLSLSLCLSLSVSLSLSIYLTIYLTSLPLGIINYLVRMFFYCRLLYYP